MHWQFASLGLPLDFHFKFDSLLDQLELWSTLICKLWSQESILHSKHLSFLRKFASMRKREKFQLHNVCPRRFLYMSWFLIDRNFLISKAIIFLRWRLIPLRACGNTTLIGFWGELMAVFITMECRKMLNFKIFQFAENTIPKGFSHIPSGFLLIFGFWD